MCGRYYIDIDPEVLKEIFEAVERSSRESTIVQEKGIKRGEIFPTDVVPIETKDGYQAMKWGFARPNGKGQVINARSETASEKYMFKDAMLHRRCLVPASGYYEWETVDKKKIRNAFYLKDKQPLYMAGIYRHEKDIDIPTFVILTKDAPEPIEHIHNRMPVIIPKEHQADWLKSDISAIEYATENVSWNEVVS